jgi:peptidoglycan hydrolase-like protein with peptidoglycan-binding domain
MRVSLTACFIIGISAAVAHAQDLPGSGGLAYTQTLSPGAVAAVQQALTRSNAYGGRADGVWGRDSASALQRYQQSHRLQASGNMNAATAQSLGIDPAMLLGSDTSPRSSNVSQRNGGDMLTPASLRVLQERLRSLGFYRGTPDGEWGSGTEQALREYQQSRGLTATGILDDNTVRSLQLMHTLQFR